jgi:hypothetical protein
VRLRDARRVRSLPGARGAAPRARRGAPSDPSRRRGLSSALCGLSLDRERLPCPRGR